ncbi:MAG: hypothetical protein VX684_08760, partial [Planctomycetota bacterium]|nr:hypothetical protein [Planctomycetota bacterium]
MSLSIEELASTATEVIETASLVVAGLAAEKERISAVVKDDRSPVTVADYSVQAIVGLHLRDCSVRSMVGEEDAERLREDPALRSEVVATTRRVVPGVSEDEVLESIDSGCHEGGAHG